jgi:transcriptional regulator with XRE-family HTH domain
MDFQEISAEEWRDLRRKKGWTQHQTAAAAGLSSQGVVSQIENGLRPGKQTARRLAEAFGLITSNVTTGKVKVTADAR